MKKSLLLGILVALTGALFALALHRLWSLNLRWFVVVTAGLVLLSVAMIFAPRFSDFLSILLFFAAWKRGRWRPLFICFLGESEALPPELTASRPPTGTPPGTHSL